MQPGEYIIYTVVSHSQLTVYDDILPGTARGAEQSLQGTHSVVREHSLVSPIPVPPVLSPPAPAPPHLLLILPNSTTPEQHRGSQCLPTQVSPNPSLSPHSHRPAEEQRFPTVPSPQNPPTPFLPPSSAPEWD